MNKTELIAAVAESNAITKKDAEKAVTAVFETIANTLKAGEKVSVVGFGAFEVKDRPARVGHNPMTGEVIEIAASRSMSFKPSKNLKASLN
ncbi:MAG TPA: HU family DNA-binding protein [Eubacteriales bacterium]|nr:HU family DNA-binding protein [Eubacteriales bacterium]